MKERRVVQTKLASRLGGEIGRKKGISPPELNVRLTLAGVPTPAVAAAPAAAVTATSATPWASKAGRHELARKQQRYYSAGGNDRLKGRPNVCRRELNGVEIESALGEGDGRAEREKT